MLHFAFKEGKEWLDFYLPITREEVDAMRQKWREWLREHNDDSLEDASTSNGACLRLCSTPVTDKWNGFDRIILGKLIIREEKRLRWL